MKRRAQSLSPQPWAWSGPRVLMEHSGEAAGLALATELRRAGYAVAVCPGPGTGEHCPLEGPEGCSAAHGADVVVSSLGLERREARNALAALRRNCPDTPLIVTVAPGQDAEWAELLDGSRVVASTTGPQALVAAVDDALGERREEA